MYVGYNGTAMNVSFAYIQDESIPISVFRTLEDFQEIVGIVYTSFIALGFLCISIYTYHKEKAKAKARAKSEGTQATLHSQECVDGNQRRPSDDGSIKLVLDDGLFNFVLFLFLFFFLVFFFPFQVMKIK